MDSQVWEVGYKLLRASEPVFLDSAGILMRVLTVSGIRDGHNIVPFILRGTQRSNVFRAPGVPDTGMQF